MFNIGTDVPVFLCFLILIATVVFALLFWTELGKVDQFSYFTYIARNVYAFYLGWVLGASNLNFGIILVYWWGVAY